jgi:hypothetical protein
MVWVGLLEEPLEVVRGWPRRMFVTVHDDCGAQNVGAAHVLVAAVVTAGHGRSPLKALLAPLIAAFDILVDTVSSDIGRCLLVTARCRLLASLYRVKHDRIIGGVLLGLGATQLPERASEEGIMFVLPQALSAVLRQHARATQVSLTAILGLIAIPVATIVGPGMRNQ